MIRRILLIGPEGVGKRSFIKYLTGKYATKGIFENYEICTSGELFDYAIIMIDCSVDIPESIEEYIAIAKRHVAATDIVLCLNKIDLGKRIKSSDLNFGIEYYYTSTKTGHDCKAIIDHFMILRERLYAQMTFINYTNIIVEE
jgi:signal recognition particle receptor subunit beta